MICMGTSRVSTSTLSDAAILGVRAANEKNAALPEPIRKAQPEITRQMRMIRMWMPRPVRCTPAIMASTAPILIRPVANTSARHDQADDGGEAGAHAFVEVLEAQHGLLEVLGAAELEGHGDEGAEDMAVTTSMFTLLWNRGPKPRISIMGMMGSTAKMRGGRSSSALAPPAELRIAREALPRSHHSSERSSDGAEDHGVVTKMVAGAGRSRRSGHLGHVGGEDGVARAGAHVHGTGGADAPRAESC